MSGNVIVGIDFGKHIGLAYSVGSLAVPYDTVLSIEDAAKKIMEKRATMLVIGWPLLLNGKEGEQCYKTKVMLEKLLEIYQLPYKLQDERMSSRFSGAGGRKNVQGRNVSKADEKDEHAHSAAWILQTYLNRL